MAEVGIHITSSGAAQGKAALDGLSNGMKNVVNEHNKMAEKFGNKIEHIGLKAFASQALHSAGLGREANEVIRLMQMSFNALQTSAAALAGPITILIGVIGAAVLIFREMKKAAEEKKKALEDLAKSTREQLKATDDIIKSINDFVNTVKDVPPELLRWRDAEDALRKVQMQRMLESDRAMVHNTIEIINTIDRRREALRELIPEMEKEIEVMKRSQDQQDQLMAATQIRSLEKLRQEEKKLGDQRVENKAKLEGLFVEIKRLTDGQTASLADQTKAWKDNEAAATKAAKEALAASEKLADEETARYQNWAKLHEETVKKNQKLNKEYNEEYEKLGKGAAKSVGQAFGDSFVQMAFHGKNFVESMEQAFQHMTEQIIADIIRIKIEYAILNAMSGGTAGGVGAIFGGMQAEGGSYTVTKPTMFIAGETGQPEVATFTPLSKMGGGASIGSPKGMGGGGTTIIIENIENNAHGIQNPALFADQVGRAIINRIRGMGELNFTQGS